MELLLVSMTDQFDHQTMMYELALELNKSRIETATIGLSKLLYQTNYNSNNYFFNAPSRPGFSIKSFKIITFFKIIIRIKKINPQKVVFLTSHLWNIPLIIFLKVFLRKTILLHSIHDFIPHEGDRQAKSVDKYTKLITKLVHYIVLYNNNATEVFSKRYSFESSKIKNISYWKKFPDYRKPINSKVFLFFGRINYYKGVQYLEQIIDECKDIKFKIVGRVDKGVEDYIEKIKKYNNVDIYNQYVFGKTVENTFYDADWVILPYNSATMSGVIIDSYRFSRPVIAFDVGGISEQIDDGDGGYLIKPTDIKGFINKIKECNKLTEKELSDMSFKAYQNGFSKYGLENSVENFINIIMKGDSNEKNR